MTMQPAIARLIIIACAGISAILYDVLAGDGAHAQDRATHVALIFGNSDYRSANILENPKNDAEDLSISFSEMGYEVETVYDADFETMRRALADFSSKARSADVAVVYFAGHGIEVDKHNYLIPVDATLENDSQVAFQTISLDMMLQAVSHASKLRMVLLDACRNNPFLQKMKKAGTAVRSGLGRGLAAVETETGTVVSFAAAEGTVAQDGKGRNSPYAAALLKYIDEPRLDVGRMFRKVRDDVLAATGRTQEPFVSSSLPGDDVFLVPGGATFTEEPARPADPQDSREPRRSEARAAWEAIRNSEDARDFEVFLEHYADSLYGKFARGRLERFGDARSKENPELTEEDLTRRENVWRMALYADLDLYGGDISGRGYNAASVAECASRCGSNLACRAFTYNHGARRCFLKSSYQFAQKFSGAVTGVFFKGSNNVDAPVFDVEWQVFSHADIGGIDMQNVPVDTFQSCLANCDASRGCAAFAFVHFTRQKQCWLKSGTITGPIYNANARKGVISGKRINQTIEAQTVQTTVERN